MNASRLCLSALTVVALAIGLFTAPAKAHADTYELFDLGGTSPGHFVSILGITASGTVVLDYHIPVGADPCKSSNICNEYETWVNGVMVSNSFTNPGLTYDNGTACTVSAPFLTSSVPGTCNNGHEVYNAGSAAMAPYTDATFTGPDPVTDLFAVPPITVSEVNLNSSGDFAYVRSHPAGANDEEVLEAIDLTTGQVPEPGSIFLLATGLLAGVGTMRRCLSQYKET